MRENTIVVDDSMIALAVSSLVKEWPFPRWLKNGDALHLSQIGFCITNSIGRDRVI